MQEAALTYAKRLDWAVFPLAPKRKFPAVPKRSGGSGCKDATTDATTIARWWRIDPARNVGIATGSPSGFFAVDVDPRNGGDMALERLEREHGRLPETVESITGGGGKHSLYRMVPALTDVTWTALAPGVDVKGTGGYIVAPPSIHPDGPAYAWAIAHGPFEHAIAPPPPWLVERLTRSAIKTPIPRSPDYWRMLVRDGVDHGRRNHAVAQLAGYLFRRQVDPYAALELVLGWNARRCRPPLPESEVVRTVDSIARREARRRRAAT